MPSAKRIKSFYIDTNIALDYITARNRTTVTVMDKIKDKGWKCVSGSFIALELADYKKDSLYVTEKAIEEKWEMRKILRNANEKDLRQGDFDKVYDWFWRFPTDYKNLDMYDFLHDREQWNLAQDISFNSNLSAPDSIHLASAIIAATGGFCQIFITNDKLLKKEGERFLEKNKLKSRLKIMNIDDVKKILFPIKKGAKNEG